MEFKLIVYILLGIGYFIYSIIKKGKEAANNSPHQKNPARKNPIEEILEQMKRAQEAAKAAQAPPAKTTSASKPSFQQQKEILLREKKQQAILFEEGTNMEATYEREQTFEEQLHEQRMKSKSESPILLEESESYSRFNAREAFIASTIFERKY